MKHSHLIGALALLLCLSLILALSACSITDVDAPDAPTELTIPTKEEIERDRSEIYNPWNA